MNGAFRDVKEDYFTRFKSDITPHVYTVNEKDDAGIMKQEISFFFLSYITRMSITTFTIKYQL